MASLTRWTCPRPPGGSQQTDSLRRWPPIAGRSSARPRASSAPSCVLDPHHSPRAPPNSVSSPDPAPTCFIYSASIRWALQGISPPSDDWKPGPPAPSSPSRLPGLDPALPASTSSPAPQAASEASLFSIFKTFLWKFITRVGKSTNHRYTAHVTSQRVWEQHTNAETKHPRPEVPAPPSSLLPKDHHYHDFNATDGSGWVLALCTRFTVLYSLYCIYLTGEPVYTLSKIQEQQSHTHSGQTSFTLRPSETCPCRKSLFLRACQRANTDCSSMQAFFFPSCILAQMGALLTHYVCPVCTPSPPSLTSLRHFSTLLLKDLPCDYQCPNRGCLDLFLFFCSGRGLIVNNFVP